MNAVFAVMLAFGAILWPCAFLLALGWRDRPGSWTAQLIDALDHGLFGGRP